MYPGISSTLSQKHLLYVVRWGMYEMLREAMKGQIFNALGWLLVVLNLHMGTRNLTIRAFPTVSNTRQAYNVSKPAWKVCWWWRLHLLLLWGRISRILGMPLSHLFLLSLCFASVRFQMNIRRSAQKGMWQHTCHAFPLPTHLPCRQKVDLLMSYCLERQNPMGLFSPLFSEVVVFFFLCCFFIRT